MKTYKQIVQETVDAPRSPDERRFLQKHIVKVTDYPVDNPEPKTKMKKRRGDLTDGEDKKVYEEKMTDAKMKKREDIVKGMKKSAADLKKRYGDRWKEVMYATATKQAMESFDLDESFKAGSMQLRDGSSVTLSNEDAAALNELYKNLNPDNKNKMQKRLESNEKAFNEVLAFAKEAM